MTKRILGLLVCFALVACLLPVTSRAVTTINTVEIVNFAEPVDGNSPFFGAMTQTPGCKIHSVEWYDVDANAYLHIGDKFVAGTVYQAIIWVEADDGYEFSYTNSYTTNVSATLNGKTAKVNKAYEYNAWAMVEITYTFEPCPKKEIKTLELQLDAAEEGKYVPFNFSNQLTNVVPYPELNFNRFYPTGFHWSNSSTVSNGARFQGGCDYWVEIALRPLYSTYTFAEDFSATINGRPAIIKQLGKDYVLLSMEFTCYGTIKSYHLSPVVSLPIAGNTPAYGVTYAYPQCEHIDYATVLGWYDVQTGRELSAVNDTFQAGKQYRVEVECMAAYAYKFDRNMEYSPLITGHSVDSYYFGYNNYYGRETITLVKTFTVPGGTTPPPEPPPVTPTNSRGDLNQDGQVNDEDVAYLLWYTLFPDDYPISVDADYTGDGSINNEDVAYLLWYTLFPDDYPI